MGSAAAHADARAPDRPTAICVLGPGRTGTSLTVRLLGLAGVYLGPEAELLSRTGIPANPKGFWEHRGIARVNQRVLDRLGGSWSEPPPLPPGWADTARLAPEHERARALLERDFGGRALWGWKDSRNSLTLPFWQRLLPAETCELRYVICLRNPVDVAASLTPPRPLSREQAVDLWALYVASALANTAGRSRLLVRYEDYFREWRGTVERLLRFAGLEPPPPGGEAEARLREFTDRDLWRHRTSTEEALRDPAVSERSRSLHLIVERLAAAGPDPEPDLAEAADACARSLLAPDPSPASRP